MREIKFRAWDKLNKEMVFDLALGQRQGRQWTILESQKRTCDYCDADSIDFDYMQYTGLKDKSGKEIYEGDIIEYMALFVHGPRLVHEEIKWNRDYASFSIVPENIKVSKVVGNIYENPDLIPKPS
jgi:uncharacterized phage protein (TIGR01671 family)